MCVRQTVGDVNSHKSSRRNEKDVYTVSFAPGLAWISANPLNDGLLVLNAQLSVRSAEY